MNKQAGMLRMKWCWALCLILSGVFCQGLMAEGVPGAMKYQAVLRDMEGNPMTNQEGLGIRITLRQGSPTGAILYQETHQDIKTDAFGLMQLEIGRGKVAEVGSETLLKVSWEDSPIYAQIEVENDGNGFTTMGASELLSVPYAIYAGNAGGGLDLTDGFVPKYNGLSREFEDSKIKENPMEFIEFYPGNGSYSFPKTRGKEGEVLILMDDDGVLGWRSSSDSNKCMDCKDDYLTYWDKIYKVWRTSKMKYVDVNNTVTVESKFVAKDTVMIDKEGLLRIETHVTGNHNLQYSELPEHHVWVGNPAQRSLPYKLGAGITLDSTSPDERVLNVNSGVSVWEYRGEGTTDYIHTKIDPSRQVKVGVGLSEPKTRFHVKDGSMLFSASNGTTDAVSDLDKGYHFYWSGEKGALRMGKFSQDASALWRADNLGEGSIALGTDAEAKQADNVAIGAGALATGIRSLAMGRNVQANASKNGVAVGNNVLVSGLNAIGIGNGSYEGNLSSSEFVASGANSVTIGNDIKNVKGDGSVTIGLSNEISANKSVVIGSSLKVPGDDVGTNGTTNVVIGENIEVGTWNYMVQIGRNLTTKNNNSSNSISIGSDNTMIKGAFDVNLGNNLTTENTNQARMGAVNIGYKNTIRTNIGAFADGAPVLVGQSLSNQNNDKGVVVGRFNAAAAKVGGVNSAFVVGVGTKETDRKNALELYENGDLYLIGPVGTGARLYSNGYNITSDRRLKTDIEPLNADFSVLKSLSPVRYRFIADQNQTLQFGFIAQDVERYFPHLVDTDSKGMKSLNYIGLLPVLWQYTQQLEKTVSDQAAEIERLRTETEALKADMKAIKAKLGL